MKDAFPTVEQVYVWHALCGYWGGLRPGAEGLPPAKVVAPKLSPGLQRTMEDLAVDKIVNNGVGLVDPKRAHELYEGLHSHLKASGIDGVKVDVIHVSLAANNYVCFTIIGFNFMVLTNGSCMCFAVVGDGL
jgi:raffinose synthase